MFRMYGWKGPHLENFLNINNFETENATLKHTFLVSFDLIKAKPSSLIDLLFLLQRLILQYLHIFDLQLLLLFYQRLFKLLLNNLGCWFFTMLFFYSTIDLLISSKNLYFKVKIYSFDGLSLFITWKRPLKSFWTNLLLIHPITTSRGGWHINTPVFSSFPISQGKNENLALI